jgi:hypothetical protein
MTILSLVAPFALFQSTASPANPVASDSWLSIVGGGLVAAIVTIAFNAYWDTRKEKRAEDWEFRRYQANVVHACAAGLREAFYAATMEFDYLVAALGLFLTNLQQIDARADAIVRQQGGPALTVEQLEQRKAQLMEPFRAFNDQQVHIRWNTYEQKGKELEARALASLKTVRPLIPDDLNNDLQELFADLSADFVWDLNGAKEKLELFSGAQERFEALQVRLARQIEVKLGR